MIILEHLAFGFPGSAGREILRSIDAEIADGEWIALTGGNGSRKSTLCRLIAGLEKPSRGKVLVDGRPPREHRRPEGDVPVGIVFQNPDGQFLAATVERELRFGLENIGLTADGIADRLDGASANFVLGGLLDRNPHLLSGGEKQRVLLAAVWALRPRHIILDEPCSFLDRTARYAVLESVKRTFHEQGRTVIWATLEPDEILLADRAICLDSGHIVYDGKPEGLAQSVPEGVLARPFDTATGSEALVVDSVLANAARVPGSAVSSAGERPFDDLASVPEVVPGGQGAPPPAVSIRGAQFAYEGGDFILEVPELDLGAGGSLGIAGPSGSGKSTLLLGLSGLLPPIRGELVLLGKRIRSKRDFPFGRIAVLFQTPEESFFAPTVRDEIAFGYRSFHSGGEAERAVRDAMGSVGLDPDLYLDRSPFMLSQGEKRLVALASMLVLPAELFCMDEPTIFLDGTGRRLFLRALEGLRSRGCTVTVATHDGELLSATTDRRYRLGG